MMNQISTLTFSQKIKDELVDQVQVDRTAVMWELWAALVSSAGFGGGKIRISTGHKGFAHKLKDMIKGIYGAGTRFSKGKDRYTLSLEDTEIVLNIMEDLREKLAFNHIGGTISLKNIDNPDYRRSFLKGVFEAIGSMGDPLKSYHLELTTRRQSVCDFIHRLLREEELGFGYMVRSNYHVLYMKEGRQISDFLLIIGAHNAMLQLESLMVDKSVRNLVNRTVNCDNANIDRITQTGMRQQALLTELKDSRGLEFLPLDLKQAALHRIKNPEMSIKELGEIMDPPIGKSGMSHRLRKLEAIAKQELEKLK